MRSACLIAAGIAAAGCAALEPEAGFPVSVPNTLDAAHGAVAVVGDLQMTPWLVRAVRGREHNEHAQALLIADLHARLDDVVALVIVGDLVFNARSRRDWAHFDSLIAPIAARVPVLPALGNHDYRCWFVELCTQSVVPENVRLRFPWLEPGRPYRVAFGDVALLFLDSETGLEGQEDWLAEALARARAERSAAVVFLHRPPHSNSVDRVRAAQRQVRDRLLSPIGGGAPAPLVVSGHEHGYEHLLVDGVHFVVTAGGGGPRDWLTAERPHDVYAGPNCAADASGRVLRPFNYLLIRRAPAALNVAVRGLCKQDRRARELASFDIPLPR